MNTSLPQPTPEAQAAVGQMQHLIRQTLQQSAGWIPFSRFMELALYAPQYGYYTGGAHKIGREGDFVTAPTLGELFGRTLARQFAELLPQTAGCIYEFGAGTGALAVTLLNNLPPESLQQYCIIEVSPELAERQRQYIRQSAPRQAGKIRHLDTLPEYLDGIVIGNEVLDAMPVEIVHSHSDGLYQAGVAEADGQLVHSMRPLQDPSLLRLCAEYFPDNTPYTSELHPAQYAFVRTVADKLQRGALILTDYGFPAAEYYHPQRNEGTLIGHYRHHTVHDPFFQIGLTDLTAHVNFTDIAQAGTDGGLDLIGYTTQSRFLRNLGITGELSALPAGSTAYLQAAAELNILTAEHEMGELFKVIAFGRNIDIDWTGFSHGDLCHKL